MRKVVLLLAACATLAPLTILAKPPIPVTRPPSTLMAQTDPESTPSASEVSNDVFGPRKPVDEAYGAFQRGYYLTALSLALKRAKDNDGTAQTLVGEIYANGLGVAQDVKKAARWYTLADHNGDVHGTFALAALYQQGQGVTKDPALAAKLFEKAAKAGYLPAKYNVALLYVQGKYVKPDMRKAAQLMREAALAGLPDAQYDYGTMLMEGAGVAPDPELGARETGLAAQQGVVAAQVDYATMLYLGKGVKKNVKAAARWYARAAESGNPVAQNRYAKLLAVGEGVDLDLQSAAMWRILAQRQGLNDPSLDKLLVSISPEDLDKAKERARYWPGTPPAKGAPQVPPARSP